MFRLAPVWLLVASVWCNGVAAGAAPLQATDDRGKTLELPAPAQRIVALAPFITELVYAAGVGERLVGTALYSDYPEAARRLPLIGDASRVDLERVLSLMPDLVIGWRTGNQSEDIERLEQLGIPVLVVEASSLAAIARLLRTFGALGGNADAGTQAALEFERSLESLAARYSARPQVRVFYEVWDRPLMTVNDRHIISDVMRLCGGHNVFGAIGNLTPVVGMESLMAARPETVVGGSSATGAAQFVERWRDAGQWTALRGIPALYVDPDWIQRQTPRILKAASMICDHFERVRSIRR